MVYELYGMLLYMSITMEYLYHVTFKMCVFKFVNNKNYEFVSSNTSGHLQTSIKKQEHFQSQSLIFRK